MATNALWPDLCSGSLMYSIYVTDVISLLSPGGRDGGREGKREGVQDQAWSLSWEPPTEQQHPKQQFTRINGPDSYRLYLPFLPSSPLSLSHSPSILNLPLPHPSLFTSLSLPLTLPASYILPLCLSLSPTPSLLPSPSLSLPPNLPLPPFPPPFPLCVTHSLFPSPSHLPSPNLYRPPPLSLPPLSLSLTLSHSLSLCIIVKCCM